LNTDREPSISVLADLDIQSQVSIPISLRHSFPSSLVSHPIIHHPGTKYQLYDYPPDTTNGTDKIDSVIRCQGTVFTLDGETRMVTLPGNILINVWQATDFLDGEKGLDAAHSSLGKTEETTLVRSYGGKSFNGREGAYDQFLCPDFLLWALVETHGAACLNKKRLSQTTPLENEPKVAHFTKAEYSQSKLQNGDMKLWEKRKS